MRPRRLEFIAASAFGPAELVHADRQQSCSKDSPLLRLLHECDQPQIMGLRLGSEIQMNVLRHALTSFREANFR